MNAALCDRQIEVTSGNAQDIYFTKFDYLGEFRLSALKCWKWSSKCYLLHEVFILPTFFRSDFQNISNSNAKRNSNKHWMCACCNGFIGRTGIECLQEMYRAAHYSLCVSCMVFDASTLRKHSSTIENLCISNSIIYRSNVMEMHTNWHTEWIVHRFWLQNVQQYRQHASASLILFLFYTSHIYDFILSDLRRF